MVEIEIEDTLSIGTPSIHLTDIFLGKILEIIYSICHLVG
jgi:hypothetical protein